MLEPVIEVLVQRDRRWSYILAFINLDLEVTGILLSLFLRPVNSLVVVKSFPRDRIPAQKDPDEVDVFAPFFDFSHGAISYSQAKGLQPFWRSAGTRWQCPGPGCVPGHPRQAIVEQRSGRSEVGDRRAEEPEEHGSAPAHRCGYR